MSDEIRTGPAEVVTEAVGEMVKKDTVFDTYFKSCSHSLVTPKGLIA